MEATREWLGAVARLVARTRVTERVDVVVFPTYLSLAVAGELLAGTGVRHGAQDVFREDTGAYTGEVSAPMLAEVGCSYAEVGHAERRRLFGEDDVVVARKAAARVRAGLTPLVCVGETEEGGVAEAVQACRAQTGPVPAAAPARASTTRWPTGSTASSSAASPTTSAPSPPCWTRSRPRRLRAGSVGRWSRGD